ncbi:MAG: hypothetical protein B6D68_00345 [spirochete symbiont of Stewartia floridana]|nr:MAG: hypothetical protein B6D68_00345 [spirochete symbiont of Stewartia floridana]
MLVSPHKGSACILDIALILNLGLFGSFLVSLTFYPALLALIHRGMNKERSQREAQALVLHSLGFKFSIRFPDRQGFYKHPVKDSSIPVYYYEHQNAMIGHGYD